MVESLARIIFPEVCSDKYLKLIEMFRFYQIDKIIKISRMKSIGRVWFKCGYVICYLTNLSTTSAAVNVFLSQLT